MKRILQYILSFLILVLSTGQKDITLLIQNFTKKEYVLKYDSENDEDGESEEEPENEKPTKEKVEEEIEGKKKKNNNYFPNTHHINSITYYDYIKLSFAYIESLYSYQNSHQNIPKYIKNCSLVLYDC